MASSRIDTADINIQSLEAVKKINSIVFPVGFPDSFYELESLNSYSKTVWFNDIMVGAICVGKLKNKPKELYIYTIAVLAAYRDLGLGSKLLKELIEKVKKERNSSSVIQEDERIEKISLNVQTNNKDGIDFYKRFGFKLNPTELNNYYPRLNPSSAFEMTFEF